MIGTRIMATASAAPDQVISNDDLAELVDTSDDWIVQRTGIKSRHISAGENTSVFVNDVARQLLSRANVSAKDIDLIVVASITQDYAIPPLSCMVQREIGADNAVAFDVLAACSGFTFALSIADKYIRSGVYKNALVIGGEVLSKFVDWTDRSTCILFGDGAGGAYVEAAEGSGIICEEIGSNGSWGDILTMGYTDSANIFNGKKKEVSPEWYIRMDGREVFTFATKKVSESLQLVLKKGNLNQEDVKYVVPHQANLRIVETVAKKSGIPFEKFYLDMDHYGNTSSASIPIALNELNEKGLIDRGDKIVLTGFGGGMTWASMLIIW